jgi:hypothetical protein
MGSVFEGTPSAPKYNEKKALESQAQNMQMNQYGMDSPFGSINWTGNPLDGTRKMEVTLSPFERAKLNSANNMLGSLSSNYGDEAVRSAQTAAYNTFKAQNAGSFQAEMDDMQMRLENQGIPVGSEAYNNALRSLSQAHNAQDLAAQNQALLTGLDVQTSQLNNALNLFNNLQNVNNPVSSYLSGVGAQNQDTYSQKFGADMDAFKQKSSNYNSQLGTLGTALSSPISSLTGIVFSDARVKENIIPVGKLYNGLTVYLFNFKGESCCQLGLLAQEVVQFIPEAVSQTDEGVLTVNYAEAVKTY